MDAISGIPMFDPLHALGRGDPMASVPYAETQFSKSIGACSGLFPSNAMWPAASYGYKLETISASHQWLLQLHFSPPIPYRRLCLSRSIEKKLQLNLNLGDGGGPIHFGYIRIIAFLRVLPAFREAGGY
jgi:hypothetical protein